jgi:hypothetical protein
MLVRGSRWLLLLRATAATGATVGHGLGVAPQFMDYRQKPVTRIADFWSVYHKVLAQQILSLSICNLQLRRTDNGWRQYLGCWSFLQAQCNDNSVGGYCKHCNSKVNGHLRRLLLRPSSRVLFFWQLYRQWQHSSGRSFTGFQAERWS